MVRRSGTGPGAWAGAGAGRRNLRAWSSLGTSLMLASRHRISPASLNSEISLPKARNQRPSPSWYSYWKRTTMSSSVKAQCDLTR